MSYSFNVRGASVAAAVAAVAPAMAKVVESQPVHAKDQDAALATATAIAGLIGEPGEGQEVSISVSGWVQWQDSYAAGDPPPAFTGASVTVQASLIASSA